MPDFSDIPDEAWIDVVAAVGWDESDELWPVLQKAVAAALPIVLASRDEEHADLVAEVRQKDADLEEWRTGVRRLPASRDSETAELRAELERHQTGESYEIGENYGRTTQADECVRELLDAVYPGDPMPDRPLDTIWKHLLEQVRKQAVEVAELRRRDAEYTASLRGKQ